MIEVTVALFVFLSAGVFLAPKRNNDQCAGRDT